MKLLRLELRAFGPFTGQTLDFSTNDAPLHIVYGPNEAGKSSALRALRQLLFGIDARTTDAFLHPMTSLRIGAALAGEDGSLLECVRRKGNKNTLSDAADEKPLEEELLTRLHGGLDAATFQSLFGIDHNELVRGGQAILQGKGSLGETLFSAASGLSDLRAVTEEYEQQAEGIYAPRDTRPDRPQAG